MTNLRLGIVGRNGSGKSSVCDYLKSKGFNVVSLSDVVRYHAKKRGLNDDRITLTQLANELKTERGLDYFAQASIAHAKHFKDVVFDSIRHPSEVELFQQHQITLLGVDADLKDCYDRIKMRGKGTDFVTFEEFKAQDDYEMSGQSHGQCISDCLELCNVRITNDQDMKTLFHRVDDVLMSLKVHNHVE
ncbi:MAG: AAA family ATPase [Candidatus Margulisiibacteriota bacterium]